MTRPRPALDTPTLEAIGLQLQFGGRHVVPLAEIAELWFGLGAQAAAEAARDQSLPVPVFRARDNQRCPWMVSVADLAAHIRKQREQAAEEHARLRSGG